jgi:hypothetical protein
MLLLTKSMMAKQSKDLYHFFNKAYRTRAFNVAIKPCIISLMQCQISSYTMLLRHLYNVSAIGCDVKL